MPTSTEKPILMSGAMVEAILEGKKTMTRRVVKTQNGPIDHSELLLDVKDSTARFQNRLFYETSVRCPFGKVGDRLWVRETIEVSSSFTDDGRIIFCDGALQDVGPLSGDIPEASLPGYFRWIDRSHRTKKSIRVPSIYMPRWASRITLQITEIRVERVNDICGEGAMAEGIEVPDCYECDRLINESAVRRFHALWDSINGKREGCDWKTNPWVWVVGFRALTAEELS